jgi:hypothetical protein
MVDTFWRSVKRVIHESDVVVEVLDARFIEDTRNRELEQKIRAMGRPLVFALCKADMAKKSDLEKAKKRLVDCAFVSTKSRWGAGKLRELILKRAAMKGIDEPRVGIVGYPNTGKSSVINMLKGRKSARTSPEAGRTRGMQYLRAPGMMLIDTPGVIPYKEEDQVKHITISVQNIHHMQDSVSGLLKLMTAYPGVIEKHYGVNVMEDMEEAIGEIALKMHTLKKGGVPDMDRIARIILKEWQAGKILRPTDIVKKMREEKQA